MKIVIVNAHDLQGGAARAAYRLHKALLKQGTDSTMLVQNKISNDFTVAGPNTKVEKISGKIRSVFDPIPVNLYKNRYKTLFSPAWVPFSDIVKKINKINPDIVHLHWINDGMMRIEHLGNIRAPIVWSLHDMWPFTGGCHYNMGCDRYKDECGNCKVLRSSKKNDISRRIYNQKQKVFEKKKDITVVGLSSWINTCSKSSSLFKNLNHINLPNCIDTDTFKPFDKKGARLLWGLPEDKKLILFGAMNATSDPRKGFNELKEALRNISKKNTELVVFGSDKPKNDHGLGFRTNYVGRLNDDISMITLYSAVDLVVSPSLQENLSNVIMESLACGCPVIAFDIGGNHDMIDHRINGYLVKPYDKLDLAEGIKWILENPEHKVLKKNARDKILSEYGERTVVEQYIKLYKSLLKN